MRLNTIILKIRTDNPAETNLLLISYIAIFRFNVRYEHYLYFHTRNFGRGNLNASKHA